jgi:hypothetical protein
LRALRFDRVFCSRTLKIRFKLAVLSEHEILVFEYDCAPNKRDMKSFIYLAQASRRDNPILVNSPSTAA